MIIKNHTHKHPYTRAHKHMYAYMHPHTRVHTSTSMHTCMIAHMHASTHTHSHTLTYANTHIHSHKVHIKRRLHSVSVCAIGPEQTFGRRRNAVIAEGVQGKKQETFLLLLFSIEWCTCTKTEHNNRTKMTHDMNNAETRNEWK